MRNHVHQFDRVIIRAVLRIPDSWRAFMLAVTTVGQPAVLILIPIRLIGGGLLHLSQRYLLLGSIPIVIFLINLGIKMAVRRARPNNEYVRRMKIHTASFPSAHAATAVSCLGLAVVLIVGCAPVLLIPSIIIASLGSFLIGLSRVYLGAHYPSDVIGGWLLGAGGVVLILFAEHLVAA